MIDLSPEETIRAVRDARIAYEVAIRTEQHLRQRGCPCSDPGRVDRARARYWATVRASAMASEVWP